MTKVVLPILFLLSCAFVILIAEYYYYERPFPFPDLGLTQEEEEILDEKLRKLGIMEQDPARPLTWMPGEELTLNSRELVALFERRHPELERSMRVTLKPNTIQYEFRLGRGLQQILIQSEFEDQGDIQNLQWKSGSMRAPGRLLNFFLR